MFPADVFVNVDEGWLKGRYPNGTIYEDFEKFPAGMKGLGEWITSQPTGHPDGGTMQYGLYTCRGTQQCSTGYYSGPGSYGYEKQDVDWIVNYANASWLKLDSCAASQDHATAFEEYARFRDALNETGFPVVFNLCGWNSWYAPPDPSINYTGGASLGNSWRISGDGGSWDAITTAINVMAQLWQYTGPGGFNDPDNILGPHGTWPITQTQVQTQMVLWSVFPTQLILGEDLTKADPEYFETVGNEELLAINQDFPFAGAGQRVFGDDLTWPCSGSLPPGAVNRVEAVACDSSNPAQQFYFNSTDGTVRLASAPASSPAALTVLNCDTDDGTLVYLFPPGYTGGSSCGSANQVWSYMGGDGGNKSLVNPISGKCLDEYMWTTPRVDLWTCLGGASNEAWNFTGSASAGTPGQLINNDSGFCLTASVSNATECVNVWARPLSDGGVALAMVNNADTATTVTCDAACFAASNITWPGGAKVRDLIAHADLGVLSPPYSFSANVTGGGGSAAFKLLPA
jgi:hypothetical protein